MGRYQWELFILCGFGWLADNLYISPSPATFRILILPSDGYRSAPSKKAKTPSITELLLGRCPHASSIDSRVRTFYDSSQIHDLRPLRRSLHRCCVLGCHFRCRGETVGFQCHALHCWCFRLSYWWWAFLDCNLVCYSYLHTYSLSVEKAP